MVRMALPENRLVELQLDLQRAACALAEPSGMIVTHIMVEGKGGLYQRFQVDVCPLVLAVAPTFPAVEQSVRGSLRLGCRILAAHAERHGRELPLLPGIKNAAAVAAYGLSDNGDLNRTLAVLREFGLIGAD